MVILLSVIGAGANMILDRRHKPSRRHWFEHILRQPEPNTQVLHDLFQTNQQQN